MADEMDLIAPVKEGILGLLDGHATVEWTNTRSILEVAEFGVPSQRWARSLQVMFQAEPRGQAGGLYIARIKMAMAVVIRLSRDTEGRMDRLLEEAHDRLADVQQVLEGQSFDWLEIPMYSDLGPTQPEVFEVEPMFGFSYIEMSGEKYSVLYQVLGLDSFGDYDQGYVNMVTPPVY